ncbi:MAG: hypothetical protein SFV24_12915 [Gemmatimonadales bacterium]|nr:hypothetical protein [Gemmatimonadales bacterium]
MAGLLVVVAGCKGGDQSGGLDPAPAPTGALQVQVAGLPTGGSASLTVTGPAGFQRVLTGDETLTGLAVGSYTITAADVVADGDGYQVSPTSQVVSVRSAATATSLVTYSIATGRIALSVAGVPAGAAAVSIRRPDGSSFVVTGSETLKALVPGNYLVRGTEVAVDGDRFVAGDSALVLVTPGTAASPALVAYQLASGRVDLTIVDLPPGGTPSVVLDGPAGFSVAATGPGTLKGLPPGQYAVHGGDLTAGGDLYEAVPTPPTLQVSAAPTPIPATVRYRLKSASLALTVTGLPGGSTAAVTVTGPAGFSATVGSTQTLRGLAPGVYSIAATSVTAGAAVYYPQPALQSVTLSAGPDPVARSVAYAPGVGSLSIGVTGLPGGVNAALTIAGPSGYSATATGPTTLSNLVPGAYTVTAAAVSTSGQVYQPSPLGQTITVSVNATASATVTYAPTLGALAVVVSGLPGAALAQVTVTGPSGFNQAVTGSTTLTGLLPGSYTVAAGSVVSGGTYSPTPASQSVTVAAGATANAAVVYAGTLGGLTVTVSGLPGGAAAAVTVTGPAAFSQNVTATQSLTGLASGTYTITAANVLSSGILYRPTPTSQAKSVAAGSTTAATVTYAATGSLTVTVTGLPGAASAGVLVTGPGAYSQAVTATTTLTGLTAGTYTITATSVSFSSTNYAPTPASQTVAVTAGAIATKSVAYAAASGALTVTITGLPGAALAAVTVDGPAGYSQGVTATTTLTGLAPGSYTVTAGNVASGGTYLPTPTTQTATVSNGATANAAVSYALGAGASLNLTIDGMYLTQATAKYDGSTPVVAGRDGYLRVFVLANQANTATPSVRVRFYSGATLLQTSTITAPGASVPTTVAEGTLTSSWNMVVPASLVQANLRILADVDPTNAVAEASDGDNNFPTSGTPFAVDVRSVPTWNVRFVPVLQQVNGLQGNVTAGNTATFLVDPLKMLPVASYSADVRAVYTTTAPVLQSSNGNGAWGTILSEVNALKFTDGSNRYYYGVVKTSYGSGVAGIGYVGGGANTSLGWDHLPSGSGVMAHEVGHNMGRPHAPCGGPASPDPAYPYAGGVIGVYGLDPVTFTLKAPSTNYDLMSYCSPDWVSDYNWGKMITYRQGGANNAPPAVGAAVAGLLVWGRITATGVVLEPALRVAPPTAVPAGTAGYRIEGLAADGRVLFAHPVPVVMTGEETGAERHFATVVPIDAAQDQAIARLRLVTPTGPVERLSLQAIAQLGRQVLFRDPAAGLNRVNSLQARLNWDAATYPMAMIRDAVTGQVLSFARGGSATVWTGSQRFDVTFSDGVRSVVRRVE